MAGEPVNVNEFEELVRQVLLKVYYDFFAGRAEDQYTLKENIEAFHRIMTSAPIIVAPTSSHQLAHPEGEVATARGAAACNDYHANMVQRAERNGFRAIILTADTPRLGRKEADIRNKMISPPFRNFEGLISTELASDKGSNVEAYAAETLDPSFCWKDIAWLKSITKLPILIKGVLTCEDEFLIVLYFAATKAIEVGVAGIIVSNHGARQLDYTPASISVQFKEQKVVHAVQGKVPVLLDGGIRRGTDIFKALALGAKAVLIGRPVIYGLAAKGETGVKQVIEMLKNELEQTMALAGCCTLDDITRSHVVTEKERFLCRM
ncbi:Peroxisomal (S)-2-hydroxy-acid oxidase GLO4 [Capsicum annuum]|nr:Peroxisomal (S)-2-hydroxy-acid oxidase GLO4 [Capsicum annuum]